ncbi:MAG: segregation/condensation protein A [Candidatus Ancillula sp.]|nr:segregation/condensation protein A [Candidatus Ancillula sp.]
MSLISKHKLDVTRLSLGVITDEFVEYVKKLGESSRVLDELSSFILVAATLLDIKVARLLPGQQDFDEEDLVLLEARDLLFAKLLQYKAYKDVGQLFGEKLERGSGRHARNALIEEKFASILPPLVFDCDTRQLAMLAAMSEAAFAYRNKGVSIEHLHLRQVNVAEQGVIISKRLAKSKSLKFSELISDAKHVVIVVGRFLSLLELYKLKAVEFVQEKALGELTIKWVAQDEFDPKAMLTGSDFDTPVTAALTDTSEEVLKKSASGRTKKGETAAKGGRNGEEE